MDLLELGFELLAGIVVGIFAGMTGAGGGLLLVPILVYLGLGPLSAIATSNVAIVVTSASGTLTNLRRFSLPWRRVLSLAIPAVVCAPLGVWLATRLPATGLLIGFAMFNLVSIGLLQWRLTRPLPEVELRDADTSVPGGEESAFTQRKSPDPQAAITTAESGNSGSGTKPSVVVATGATGGVFSGLFGIGGGLIMVPLQALFLATPVRLASRISLGVVLFASLSSVLTHVWRGTDIDWLAGLMLALGGIIGAPLGAKWLHRFTDAGSTRLIQAVLAAVALSFLWQAFG